MEHNLERFHTIANKAARGAGEILREYYHSGEYHISEKQDASLVTEVDEKAEAYIKNVLQESFPAHGFLGEESGGDIGNNYSWLVDALDGTSNFIMKIPLFSVALALLYEKKPIMAFVYNPILEEFYYAADRQGAFLNGVQITVSGQKELRHSTWMFNKGRKPQDEQLMNSAMQNVGSRIRTSRKFGAAAWEACKVASGALDAYCNIGSNAYDQLGAAFIVQGAGGQATDLEGNAFDIASNTLLASNGHIHEDALAAIHYVHD